MKNRAENAGSIKPLLDRDGGGRSPARRVVVISNPMTRGRLANLERAIAPYRSAAREVTMFVTEYAGHAFDLAQAHRQEAEILVAAGGDGTVSDVASALRGSDVPLAIVPLGSTNIIARELGIPINLNTAVKLIFSDHEIRCIDVGTCERRSFLHMGGTGFDSDFFEMTDPALKRRIGWVAYLPAAIRALRRPMANYVVSTSEAEIRTTSPMVLVANGGSIINPRLKLHRDISREDGVLDVLVVTATTPMQLAQVLARLMTMQLWKSPYVVHLRTTEVRIEADPPMSVELDGDVVLNTPVRFGIQPKAIRIITPTR